MSDPAYRTYVGFGTIDFGAAPGGTLATLVVTDQPGVIVGTGVQAWMQGDTTADHTDANHLVAATVLTLRAGDFVTNVGFTVFALAAQRLTGQFMVRWIWSQ